MATNQPVRALLRAFANAAARNSGDLGVPACLGSETWKRDHWPEERLPAHAAPWAPRLSGPAWHAHFNPRTLAPWQSVQPPHGPSLPLVRPMGPQQPPFVNGHSKDTGPTQALLEQLRNPAPPFTSQQQLSHQQHHQTPPNQQPAFQQQQQRRLQGPATGPRPQQGQGGRSRAHSASIALNKAIMDSGSTERLLTLVREHAASFDFFNTSTAISKAAKLVGEVASGTISHSPSEPSLVALEAFHHTGAQDPRAGAHALSPAARELVDRLGQLAMQHMRQFDSRGLANTAWAFAKLRYLPDPALPALICQEASKKVDQFAAQQVSNLVWAMVYLHHTDEPLLHALRQQACRLVEELKPQELANIFWALASHDQLDVATVQTLGVRARQVASQLKEQELSNIVWALGRAGVHDSLLMSELVAACTARLPCFMPQGVANVVWALGQLGYQDTGLINAVQRHCTPARLRGFDAQALANLASGLVALGGVGDRASREVVAAVAEEAVTRAARMPAHQLVAVAGAAAAVGVHNDRLFDAALGALRARPGGVDVAGLGAALQALTELGVSHPRAGAVVEAMTHAAAVRAERLEGKALVATVDGLAALGEVGMRVMDAVSARVACAADTFSAAQCMSVASTLARTQSLSHVCANRLLAQVVASQPPPSSSIADHEKFASTLASTLVSAAQAVSLSDGVRLEQPRPQLLAVVHATVGFMTSVDLTLVTHALASLGCMDGETFGLLGAALGAHWEEGRMAAPAQQLSVLHDAWATLRAAGVAAQLPHGLAAAVLSACPVCATAGVHNTPGPMCPAYAVAAVSSAQPGSGTVAEADLVELMGEWAEALWQQGGAGSTATEVWSACSRAAAPEAPLWMGQTSAPAPLPSQPPQYLQQQQYPQQPQMLAPATVFSQATVKGDDVRTAGVYGVAGTHGAASGLGNGVLSAWQLGTGEAAAFQASAGQVLATTQKQPWMATEDVACVGTNGVGALKPQAAPHAAHLACGSGSTPGSSASGTISCGGSKLGNSWSENMQESLLLPQNLLSCGRSLQPHNLFSLMGSEESSAAADAAQGGLWYMGGADLEGLGGPASIKQQQLSARLA